MIGVRSASPSITVKPINEITGITKNTNSIHVKRINVVMIGFITYNLLCVI